MRNERKIEVSFILGILNAERTLVDCLEGIFMQDYPKDRYEVIIIDGGSTDNTLQIVKIFMQKYRNIKLLHNPKRLSEGKGMSKDIGIRNSKARIVILLDHDNIILNKGWLEEILFPFNNKDIMASQSLLEFKEHDNNFLKYINSAGVEDPFAIPYSLVSQVQLNPDKFCLVEGRYYIYNLDKNNLLFGGANGCAFVKKVFENIGGYTRDVDVFAKMAEHKMRVAIPKEKKIYHNTANNFLVFLKKKGIYFYRFINRDYSEKSFRWVKPGFSNKISFFLMVLFNLSIIIPYWLAVKQAIKTGRLFWLLHPFYLFFVTLEYGIVTLFKINNFFSYSQGRR